MPHYLFHMRLVGAYCTLKGTEETRFGFGLLILLICISIYTKNVLQMMLLYLEQQQGKISWSCQDLFTLLLLLQMMSCQASMPHNAPYTMEKEASTDKCRFTIIMKWNQKSPKENISATSLVVRKRRRQYQQYCSISYFCLVNYNLLSQLSYCNTTKALFCVLLPKKKPNTPDEFPRLILASL